MVPVDGYRPDSPPPPPPPFPPPFLPCFEDEGQTFTPRTKGGKGTGRGLYNMWKYKWKLKRGVCNDNVFNIGLMGKAVGIDPVEEDDRFLQRGDERDRQERN